MQLIVDQLITSYETVGKGKVVLLLHGWGDKAAGLTAIQRQLAIHYRVVTLDLPGFGGTQAPVTPWGLIEYAQFIAHFLQKVDVRAFAVIGHSNGGAIAITGLAHNMLHAERLVLLASAGVRDDNEGKRQAIQAMTKIGKAATQLLPATIKRALRAKLYRSIGSDLLVAEHMQETFKKVVRADVQDDASHIAIPTLLIYGAADDATPLVHGKRLHERIKGSRLEVLPEAGHFVHLDKPTETMRLIEEFLT